MDTIEYSELLTRFGKGLMRIAEGAEGAADGDLEGAERIAAIDAATQKLGEYQDIMGRLGADSKVLEAQFAKKFAAHVDLIRESLDRIASE